jgi:hypothetical protein
MKPDWDKLMGEYEASSNLVIGDVDCTAEQALCQEHGVSGYPTIKYWNDETGPEGAKYAGGRTFDDLQKFVDENMAAPCSVEDESSCSAKENKYIKKWAEKSADDVAAQIVRLEGMVSGSMKPELKAWIKQRLAVLAQF